MKDKEGLSWVRVTRAEVGKMCSRDKTEFDSLIPVTMISVLLAVTKTGK